VHVENGTCCSSAAEDVLCMCKLLVIVKYMNMNCSSGPLFHHYYVGSGCNEVCTVLEQCVDFGLQKKYGIPVLYH
jgi:hypothetical protein